MDKVGRYEFLAEPFHCDFSGRLFMGHLGNHMLNAADFHSTDRGFGMKYLMTIQRSWVLSRLAIEMKLYDDDYETMLHHNHDLEWKAHVENQRRRSKELEEQDKKDPVYLKYVAAKNALNAARGEVGRAEDAIHELPYNSGGLLDSDYLFLLRDRKYKEAEAALEKSRRNLRENTREEELLLRKAAAIRKMVEAEQTLRETEAEYKAYKAELDEKRKRESIEETEAFFREHGIQ